MSDITQKYKGSLLFVEDDDLVRGLSEKVMSLLQSAITNGMPVLDKPFTPNQMVDFVKLHYPIGE